MFEKLFSFFKSKKENIYSEFDDAKKEKIYSKIEDLIGERPKDGHYYIKAFTHRSFLEKTSEQIKSNERLEFLGDSILGKIVAEYLFKEYSDEGEGFLTKVRSHLVNKHSLEKIGFRLDLHELLFVNDKYLIKDKKKLANTVADCLEAVIAAIYLDLGRDSAERFVMNYIIIPQVNSGEINDDRNYKGQLLEYSHANKLNQPAYTVINQEGPQHDKIYTVEVIVNETIHGTGRGPNKKLAEQFAAKEALKKVKIIEK